MEEHYANIAAVVTDVVRKYDISEVYLFGSYARGEQTPQSDIDLRFVCGPSITFGDLYDISLELETRLCAQVEIVTNPLEKMRSRFRDCIMKDEVQLYEAA